MNQRRVRVKASVPSSVGTSDEDRRVLLLEHADDVVAVERGAGGEEHVEEPVVLEAGLRVTVPHRLVQTRGRLERQLAVQRRVDRGGEVGGSWEELRAGATGAPLEPEVRRRDLVERRPPLVGAGGRPEDGHLDERRHVEAEVRRGHRASGRAHQVVEVPQRHLEATQVEPR